MRSSPAPFFAAQIEAAKLLQHDLFHHWKKTRLGPFTNVPDLAKDLRPRIDKVSADLLGALAQAKTHFDRPETQDRIRSRGMQIVSGAHITSQIRDVAQKPIMRR